VELYLHSPNTPSWRGAQLKKKHWDNFIVDLNISTINSEQEITEANTGIWFVGPVVPEKRNTGRRG
jgi:hypothetical protein